MSLAASAAAATRFDPALRFRRLTTPHFVIYFHQGEEGLARHLAVVAEETWRELDARLGPAPSRTHVVVADDTDTANGLATPLPFNTILLTASAPSGSDTIGHTDDWLRLVLAHELTHVVHLDRTRSWARLVKGVFGRVPLAFPNLFLPSWEIEGLATYYESVLTGQGRLHAGDFRAIERVGLRAGAFPLDRANGGLVAWPAGHAAYAFGLGFHEHLATRYGPERFTRLADRSAGRVPYTASRVFKDLFGTSLGTLWREYQDAVQATARGRSEDGLPIPRQLTNGGYVTLGPRYAPPVCGGCAAEILYSTRNAHEFPALESIDADGADGGLPRRLAERYLGSTVAVSAERLIFDQQEIVRNVGLYSDLYSLDRRSGRLTRLTHEARLGDPDLSSDGTRLVAVREDRGRRDLVRLPVLSDGRLGHAETIVSAADTQFAAPRWSPDGHLGAAERRAPGISSEIVVVDVADGQVRYRARGATRAVTPAWRPDGRAVIFAADAPDGPFDLFELVLGESKPSGRQLTRVTGGATWPDVSPDGSTLAFVGYGDQGFDIYTQPYPSETGQLAAVPSHVIMERTIAADSAPSASAAAAGSGQGAAGPSAEASGASLLGERYVPWPTLVPRAWWPFVASDPDQVQLGVTTNAVDVLGYHGYSASVAWRLAEPETTRRLSGPRPDWRLAYVYDRWQPRLFVSASSSTSFLQGASAPIDGPAVLREDTVSAGAALPVQRVRHSQQVFVSVLHTASTLTSGIAPRVSDRSSARGGWSLTSARTFGYSISPEDGVSAGVTAELSGPGVGQLGETKTLTADARAYLPGLARHHVVAVRAAGGASLGGPGNLRVFELGGAATSDVIDFGRGAFSLLRGFPPDSFAGTRIVDANVEYRLPLGWVERGVGTWPIFLRSVHAAVVVDVGHAWTRRFRASDLKVSYGAELSADAVAGYALPFTITIGTARGHDGAGRQVDRTTAYLRFGRAF